MSVAATEKMAGKREKTPMKQNNFNFLIINIVPGDITLNSLASFSDSGERFCNVAVLFIISSQQ